MLSKIVKALTDKDRKVLLTSLENGNPQLLRLHGNLCIAVNMKANPDITIFEEKGHWIYGRLCQKASGRYGRRAEEWSEPGE